MYDKADIIKIQKLKMRVWAESDTDFGLGILSTCITGEMVSGAAAIWGWIMRA